MKRKSRRQKGAAAIEAALVIFLFLIPLFMGIIDAACAIYNAQIIANASREGARYGIKGKSIDQIKDRIIEYCDGRLINWGTGNKTISRDADIIIDPAGGYTELKFGDPLTVTVKFDYSTLFLDILLPGGVLTLQEYTHMKMEGI